MLKVEYQGQFKKDYKLAVKRGCNLKLLADVITMLVNEKPLPPKYKDHSLADSRNYKRMGRAAYSLTGCWYGALNHSGLGRYCFFC